MKNTGRRITCDGKRRPRTVSSMRHLLSKCGTPVRLCADPDGCVDVVFDTGLACQRRQTLALRFFPLDTCLPRVLHAEDAPRAGQRSAQCRLVIEIALDDVDAVARQRRRLLALRVARQAAQTEAAALQRPRDRAALVAGHSGNENRSIVRHGPCPSCDELLGPQLVSCVGCPDTCAPVRRSRFSAHRPQNAEELLPTSPEDAG